MFEPKIVCFFCRWCTYAGADLAGTSRKQYPPNGVVVRVNCSGRVDPQHILWAFREGADGVLIGGCHPNDCHYQDGNYKTMRRVALLKPLLEQMGIEPERLRLEWISAAEGEKLVRRDVGVRRRRDEARAARLRADRRGRRRAAAHANADREIRRREEGRAEEAEEAGEAREGRREGAEEAAEAAAKQVAEEVAEEAAEEADQKDTQESTVGAAARAGEPARHRDP